VEEELELIEEGVVVLNLEAEVKEEIEDNFKVVTNL